MTNFKIGDYVKCIDNSYSQAMSLSEIYTVFYVYEGLLGVENSDGKKYFYASRMFKKTDINSKSYSFSTYEIYDLKEQINKIIDNHLKY